MSLDKKDRRTIRTKVGEAVRITVNDLIINVVVLEKSGRAADLGFTGPDDMKLARVSCAEMPHSPIGDAPQLNLTKFSA